MNKIYREIVDRNLFGIDALSTVVVVVSLLDRASVNRFPQHLYILSFDNFYAKCIYVRS